MAQTVSESKETRIHFDLQSADGTATVDRYITVPGQQMDVEGDWLTNFYAFREFILDNANGLKQFVQPSTWRDSTGSGVDPEDASDPYTTTDVRLELYSVNRIVVDGNP